jgi:hypothetical protein
MPRAIHTTQNSDACNVHKDDKLAVLTKEEIYNIYEPSPTHYQKQYGRINYQ